MAKVSVEPISLAERTRLPSAKVVEVSDSEMVWRFPERHSGSACRSPELGGVSVPIV